MDRSEAELYWLWSEEVDSRDESDGIELDLLWKDMTGDGELGEGLAGRYEREEYCEKLVWRDGNSMELDIFVVGGGSVNDGIIV